MQSYFVWNGVDCRAMGITTRKHAPLIRPEERVQHVQIPGRSGDLTETEGAHIYNSYIQTVAFGVEGASRVREVFRWLRGSGTVSFSSDPYKEQDARIIGAVTLERVSRNLDRWTGSVQFYCQPLKKRLYPAVEELTASGTVINNGDVDAYPVILAYPGDATTMTITVNGEDFVITNIRNIRRIDSGAREVTNALRTVICTIDSSGPFPVLKPGSNTIGGSGWTKLEITKEERFL